MAVGISDRTVVRVIGVVDDLLGRMESRQARALASLDQTKRAARGQFFTPRREPDRKHASFATDRQI